MHIFICHYMNLWIIGHGWTSITYIYDFIARMHVRLFLYRLLIVLKKDNKVYIYWSKLQFSIFYLICHHVMYCTKLEYYYL